jgi:hypothetical protein
MTLVITQTEAKVRRTTQAFCNSQGVGYAARASMIWLGNAAKVWRMLQPCFLRDRAAFSIGATEGEGHARRRVQPLQLAGNAKPRFVEMANLHFGHALADA